jgi:hypothetical protein
MILFFIFLSEKFESNTAVMPRIYRPSNLALGDAADRCDRMENIDISLNEDGFIEEELFE